MYALTVGFSVEYLCERIFITVFSWAVHDGVLDPKLAFLPINHCNGMLMLRIVGTGAVLI
jgi:hypothetical protein